MASGFKINKQAIRNMTREIEKEFAKNPVPVALEADASGMRFPATTVNNYNGPVVTVHGDHAQLAWDNEAVNQTQNRVEQIAPGFEELAKVLTGLLAGLPGLGLADDDADEVKAQAETVLGEVTKDEPDEGVIKRGVTMLKGLLAPVATGVSAVVTSESRELTRTVIEGLCSTLPF